MTPGAGNSRAQSSRAELSIPAFYVRDGESFHSTELCRGPWDNAAQHGGPPGALLVGVMARHGPNPEHFCVVRVWNELLRPVPLARLRVTVEVERAGRTTQRLVGRLFAGDQLVMTARALRVARAELSLPERTEPPWLPLEQAEPFTFGFFQHPIGYHKAIDLRLARGTWGSTPIAFWARTRVPLIEGQPTSPLENLLVLADAQSGMGVPLDPRRFSFVNPDLTLHLERPPRGEWFGFDIRSTAGAHGGGLAQSEVHDRAGVVARSAQSLVVWSKS